MPKYFDYYEIQLKMTTNQLGTVSNADSWNEHIQRKAEKILNSGKKLTKKLEVEMKRQVENKDPKKDLEELHSILRRFMTMVKIDRPLPETIQETLEMEKEIRQEFSETIAESQPEKGLTIFFRDEKGWPRISSHMFLGFLKAAASVIANNTEKEKSPFKSKVAVSEMFSMDAKVIEDFLIPSMDIIKDEDGNPVLCTRTLLMDLMGKKTSCFAHSEQLPAGTEYKFHLRVRSGSSVTQELLELLLEQGKNLGLGQWRGSGNYGKFVYRIKPVLDYKEEKSVDGWN